MLHTVVLEEPFDLGRCEVTQAQYKALMGTNPSLFKESGANRPVEQVSWTAANAFGREMTKKRSDRYVYRLPTEAEWEYGCRAGRPPGLAFGVGDGQSLLPHQSRFGGKRPAIVSTADRDVPAGSEPGAGNDRPSRQEATCVVGSYPANALG